jgi:hypothetical protein
MKGLQETKIMVISGTKNIAIAIARFQSNIKKEWCACVDSSIPAFSMSKGIKSGYLAAKKRHVKIRYVTEVTSSNLEYCKELVQLVELRHLAAVRGSFAVSETEFVVGIQGKRTLKRLVYGNAKEMVEHQRDVFETIWENATPAINKIRELES